MLAKKISLKKAATTNTYELELNFEANTQTELVLFADQEGNGLSLTVDTENRKMLSLTVLKLVNNMRLTLAQVVNVLLMPVKLQQQIIFVDNSIVEIFFNKGENVFTSRVFPSAEQIWYQM